MEYYVNDFEDAMLRDTRKASSWIVEDSYSYYTLKLQEYLKKEKDRVCHYINLHGYRLFRIPNELETVANMFEQFTAEDMDLVQQSEDMDS
ncbi:hypothetical protein RDI58_006109 [Solanum bulbocastanum]|uniref:Uncharacterized protein n=1 Tax=Solanum bulbocastanum TaxID=147425 RepID=A0AAN8UAA6_SOLBU